MTSKNHKTEWAGDGRELKAHGDMFSCASSDCPKWDQCWRAQKPGAEFRQSICAPIFTDAGCDDFIGIRK